MEHQRLSAKLPSEHDIDDLLDILKDEKTEEGVVILEGKSDVVNFLSFYQIKSGKEEITSRLIYDLYRYWSKKHISKHSFEYEMGKYLSTRYSGKKVIYLIDRDYINISNEINKLLYNSTLDKTKSKVSSEHFKRFLDAYSIKSGNYWIEGYMLHNLYSKWCHYENNKRIPMNYQNFFKFLSINFEHKRRTQDRTQWFAIDPSIKEHITEETMQNIRKAHKKNHVK